MIHSGDLADSTNGRGSVGQTTAARIAGLQLVDGQHVPTLEGVAAQLQRYPEGQVLVQVKGSYRRLHLRDVYDMLVVTGLSKRVVMRSADPGFVETWRRIASGSHLAFDPTGATHTPSTLRGMGADVVVPPARTLTQTRVRRRQASGIDVIARDATHSHWPVLAADGVNGLIPDDHTVSVCRL